MGRWRIFNDPDQGDLFEGYEGVDEMRRRGSGAGKRGRKSSDKVKRGHRLSDWDLRMGRLSWGHTLTESEVAARYEAERRKAHAWLEAFLERVHGPR